VRRRTIRSALFLAGQAERRIREAGRPVPPREDLLKAFLPLARTVTRAARQLDKAARLHAQAQAVARASADTAADAVQLVVEKYLAAVPPQPRWKDFDPSRFRAALVTIPEPGDGEPAREAS
jgi:hypothetical protein